VSHTRAVAQREDEFLAKNVQLIWVLEETATFSGASSEQCVDVMSTLGATSGWCVGDDETLPTAGTFDDSPFSVSRGFDMIVPRASMRIEWTSSHGSVGGNDNASPDELLDAIDAVRAAEGLPPLP